MMNKCKECPMRDTHWCSKEDRKRGRKRLVGKLAKYGEDIQHLDFEIKFKGDRNNPFNGHKIYGKVGAVRGFSVKNGDSWYCWHNDTMKDFLEFCLAMEELKKGEEE